MLTNPLTGRCRTGETGLWIRRPGLAHAPVGETGGPPGTPKTCVVCLIPSDDRRREALLGESAPVIAPLLHLLWVDRGMLAVGISGAGATLAANERFMALAYVVAQ